jgi:hypothetical protein
LGLGALLGEVGLAFGAAATGLAIAGLGVNGFYYLGGSLVIAALLVSLYQTMYGVAPARLPVSE